MTQLFLLFFPILLLFVCLYKAKMHDGSTSEYTVLSAEGSKIYKGLFALIVVLHHISLKIQNGGVVYSQFMKIGYLAVSVFFFFSGFGLMRQHMLKEDYGKNFFRKRLPKVLVPFLTAILFYIAVYAVLGIVYEPKALIRKILNGGFIPYSWFVVCIIIFYIFFGIIIKVLKTHYYCVLAAVGIFCVLWIPACGVLRFGSEWYMSTHLLVFGVLVAIKYEEIKKFVSNHIFACLLPVSLIFLIIYAMQGKIINLINKQVFEYAYSFVETIVFVMLLLLVSFKVSVGNKLLKFFGNCSFEIYLFQGMFIKILFNTKGMLSNEFMYALLCISCTILLAAIMNFINTKLLKVLSRIGL